MINAAAEESSWGYKGATACSAGGLIEPLARAVSSIDRQTERGGQTKMVIATSTFSNERKW